MVFRVRCDRCMELGLISKCLNWVSNKMSKIKYTIKNIVYILLWAIVSLVSSFNQIIPSIKDLCKGDFSCIIDGDFYTGVIAPLLIWIIAFFIDYLYQLWTIGNNERMNEFWVKLSNFVICMVFVVLVISFFNHSTVMQQTISVICLFVSMILLKISALYVVSPSYEVEKR